MPPQQPQNNQSTGPDDPLNNSEQPAPSPSSVITPTGQAGAGDKQPEPPAVPQAQSQTQTGPTIPPHPSIPTQPQPTVTVVASTGSDVTQPITSKPKSKRLLLVSILLIVIILAGAGAFMALKKPVKDTNAAAKSNTARGTGTTKVPADWKKVDTGFGFSVQAPAAWSASPVISTGFGSNGGHGQAIEIGPVRTSAATRSLSQVEQSIIVGTLKIDSVATESAFDASVSTITNAQRSQAKALGVTDPNELAITSKTIKLNGQSWFETTFFSGSATVLYHWQKDHAICLKMMTSSKEELQQLSNNYLYPMAASLSVN